MADSSMDPVDHARTTRRHAGEAVKDTRNVPGMILVALGVVAVAVGVYSLSVGAAGTPLWALAAAVLLGGGLLWFAVAHRRTRIEEQRWHARHPGTPYQPPAS